MRKMTNTVRPVLVTLVLTLLAGIAAAGDVGRCYAAEVPSEMVLPDGSVHGPGRLKVCLNSVFTPVTGLHETSVNGRSIGQFRARTADAEGESGGGQPFFMFLRNADGALELQGYAFPRGERLRAYDMAPPGRRWNDIEVTTRWNLALARPAERSTPVALLLLAEPAS